MHIRQEKSVGSQSFLSHPRTRMNHQEPMSKTILIAGYSFPYICSDEECTASAIDQHYYHIKSQERPGQTIPIAPLVWYPLNMLGYPNYSISKDGQVFNNKLRTILQGGINHNDDYTVQLTHPSSKRKSTHQVRRLVALMFLEKPLIPGELAINIDGDKLNNHVSNIIWMYLPIKGKMRKPITSYLDLGKTKYIPWETYFSVKDAVATLGWSHDPHAESKIDYHCKNCIPLNGFLFSSEPSLLDGELWCELEQPGYETISVSNKGRIWTQDGYKGYGTCVINGYWVYHLRLQEKPFMSALVRVDKLVMLTFYSKDQIQLTNSTCCSPLDPSSLWPVHIDGNTKNNDLFNLDYCTHRTHEETRQMAGQVLYNAMNAQMIAGKIGYSSRHNLLQIYFGFPSLQKTDSFFGLVRVDPKERKCHVTRYH